MRNYRLPLEDGETVTFESPGALSVEALGRWRIGEWIKTDRRILFIQTGAVRFCVKQDALVEVCPCEREYAYKQRRCLKIVFNGEEDGKTVWMITPDVRRWEAGLAGLFRNTLTEGDIVKVAHPLGLGAEKILWHLYRRRHATISEIAKVAGAASHMDVLNIIRNEINRSSKEILGRPVLIFKQEGICPSGCRNVAYSWWFSGCQVAEDNPFCDIMDEGEYYRIIVESPPDAKIEIADNKLYLQGHHGFLHTIPLPAVASANILNKSYSNGIWEVGIEKRS